MTNLDAIKRTDMTYTLLRSKIEMEEEWMKWVEAIPPLHFKKEWAVKVIPPVTGAIVRFRIEHNNRWLSVYLDCYNKLGYFGGPYWEIYPAANGDVSRYKMEDTEGLMKEIGEILDGGY